MLKKTRTLSPREKVLLALLALMFFVSGLYQFVLKEQINVYLENRAKIISTQQELARVRKKLADEKKRQEEAKEIDARLASVLPSFNTQVQSGDALVELSWQAYQLNVLIEGVKPMPVVEEQFHLEIPLTLKISGKYNEIVEFIKGLENLPDVTEIRRADFYPLYKRTSAGIVGTTIAEPDWHQSGIIEAELDLVIFTDKTPKAMLAGAKDQMERWAVGRYNAFLSEEPTSPLKEIIITPVESDFTEARPNNKEPDN